MRLNKCFSAVGLVLFFAAGAGLFSQINLAHAQSMESAKSKVLRGKKQEIIERHRRNHVTQEQREAAAERLKQASPEAKTKIAEIRATLARARADRVSLLNKADSHDEAKRNEEILKAARREASARQAELNNRPRRRR